MLLPAPSPSQVWRWFSTTLRSDQERHVPVPRQAAEAMSFDPRPLLQELSHSPAPARPRRRAPTDDRGARLSVACAAGQKIPRPEQHGARLLSLGLHRDKAHRRSTCRLSDRFRIGSIVLLALDERFDVGGWDQTNLMPEVTDGPPPVVRAPTGFHGNDA